MISKEKIKNSVQNWLPYQNILENGIVKLKNSTYLKILKIIPINFNLKSELEKEAILNSYKLFLKTCDFDIQILIQSKKEDLSKQVLRIRENQKKENKRIKQISENYINYIQDLNQIKNSSSKNFFIIIKREQLETNVEKIAIEELSEDSFKIKECLSRCGNIVISIEEKREVKEILKSFFKGGNKNI